MSSVTKPIVSLFLSPDLVYYGGAYTQLQTLATHTDPKECQIIIASLSNAADFELQNNEHKVIVHEFNMAKKSLFYQIRILKYFIFSHNVDIIHAYGGMRCHLLTAIVGNMFRLPVIIWEIGILKYRNILGQLVDSIIEQIVNERICNSRATLKKRQECLFKLNAKWSVVYRCVMDRSCFFEKAHSGQRARIRNSLSLAKNEIALVTIGGFIPLRDHITTIRALAKMVNNGYKIKLILIGDGILRKQIENLVRDENLEDSVLFLGYIRNAAEMLPAMDIYINSAYAEGFGVATVEAMLAGLPVVAANAGANKEVLNHRRTGLLFNPGNANDLCTKIVCVLENHEMKKQLVKTAREFALTQFSPTRFVDSHLEICKRHLLGNDV